MLQTRFFNKTIAALLLVSLLTAQPAHAISFNFCSLFFWRKAAVETLVAPAIEKARETLIQQLAENKNVPAFIKHTDTGDIPVILVTANTREILKPILDNSMGTMVVQQVGYQNDHGLMRVKENIMDVDSPGARGFGEINQTGIAWKPMESYLDRRLKSEPTGYNIIEVGYMLSPQEMADVNHYQLVRRAAIIRVPFTFKQTNVDRSKPNTLSAGEHCFIFCKSSAIGSHVQEMQTKLREYGIENTSEFLAKPEVASLIKEARFVLENAKNDERGLNWAVLHNLRSAREFRKLFSEVSDYEQNLLINWVVGYDATVAYQKLRSSLGISNDGGFSDMRNTKASFVLVYGKTTDAESFKDASFNSPGVFYSWTNNNQKRLN